MQKFTFFIFLFSFSIGFSQKLEFNPKKEHPYSYQTELLTLNTAVVDLALKASVEAIFPEEDNTFSMKINRFQIKASGYTIFKGDLKFNKKKTFYCHKL